MCQKAVGRTLYVRNGGLCTPCKREFGTGPLDNAVTYPKYGVQLALDTGLPVSAQQSLDEM